jgi:hypothetical protein
MTTFDRRLAFGKLGENYIAAWLRHVYGYHVLPVYDTPVNTGKGPTLYPSHAEPLVAPDLFVFRPTGQPRHAVRWMEAKTKTAFSWHRLTSTWVTGIDLHHYEQYLNVARLMPWEVWLLFLHLGGQAKNSPPNSPSGLFGHELRYLSQREHHRSDRWGKSGMVYWAADTLNKLATLEEVHQAMETERAAQHG